jgi:hypothetical protein
MRVCSKQKPYASLIGLRVPGSLIFSQRNEAIEWIAASCSIQQTGPSDFFIDSSNLTIDKNNGINDSLNKNSLYWRNFPVEAISRLTV